MPAGTVWSDEEEKLRQDFGLDDEQLMWRRWCIKANCGNDAAMFRQEYPNTPDEAFLLSGEGYFDNAALSRQRMHAPAPDSVGWFVFDEPAEPGAAPRTGGTSPERPGRCVSGRHRRGARPMCWAATQPERAATASRPSCWTTAPGRR